ncbi:hypothetical protein L1887_54031 [Cichorium endivia]|nr:hypothetical protein L1887_54031 [Cichorium endivia]
MLGCAVSACSLALPNVGFSLRLTPHRLTARRRDFRKPTLPRHSAIERRMDRLNPGQCRAQRPPINTDPPANEQPRALESKLSDAPGPPLPLDWFWTPPLAWALPLEAAGADWAACWGGFGCCGGAVGAEPPSPESACCLSPLAPPDPAGFFLSPRSLLLLGRRRHVPCPQGDERVDESDILEQVGEDPDTRLGDDDGDEPEDEPEDGDGKEEADQAQCCHREVPNAEAHRGGPEREHDAGEHDCDHSDTGELEPELRTLKEPDVVQLALEELLLVDLDDLGRVLAARAGAAVDAEEECEGNDVVQALLRLLLGRHLGHVLELGVGGREQRLDGGRAFEVVDALAVERTYARLDARLVAQKVDHVARGRGCAGLLLLRDVRHRGIVVMIVREECRACRGCRVGVRVGRGRVAGEVNKRVEIKLVMGSSSSSSSSISLQVGRAIRASLGLATEAIGIDWLAIVSRLAALREAVGSRRIARGGAEVARRSVGSERPSVGKDEPECGSAGQMKSGLPSEHGAAAQRHKNVTESDQRLSRAGGNDAKRCARSSSKQRCLPSQRDRSSCARQVVVRRDDAMPVTKGCEPRWELRRAKPPGGDDARCSKLASKCSSSRAFLAASQASSKPFSGKRQKGPPAPVVALPVRSGQPGSLHGTLLPTQFGPATALCARRGGGVEAVERICHFFPLLSAGAAGEQHANNQSQPSPDRTFLHRYHLCLCAPYRHQYHLHGRPTQLRCSVLRSTPPAASTLGAG